MDWAEVLALATEAAEEAAEGRRVLLHLRDATYEVKEVLPGAAAGDLLGFVVYRGDPDVSRRDDESALLFVPRDRVERIVVQGQASGQLGFG